MRSRLIAALAVSALAVTPVLVAPAASADNKAKTLTFKVDYVSTQTDLTTLPGDITYGWNHLVGPTRWGKKRAESVFLGSVDYVNGSGGFGGFVTFTRSDGSRLSLSVDGWATSPDTPGTANTTFNGAVRVIGGSGAYAGARGSGTMTGYRKADLGSPVQLTFTLTVRK
ncbi:MAG: hypothetical protein VW362_03820 [Candidatus Nanopelagicales bacterium]|jgi:hypothetical protein